MGTTRAFFQSLGINFTCVNRKLEQSCKNWRYFVLSTKAGIESGPGAFSVFRSFNSLFTPLGSMLMFSIDPKWLTSSSGMLVKSSFVKTT